MPNINKIILILSLITTTNTFFIVYHLLLGTNKLTQTLCHTNVKQSEDITIKGIQKTFCDERLIKYIEGVKINSDLYTIALNDYNNNFIQPNQLSNFFMFTSSNKFVDVSIFWMEFDLFEIRYFSLYDVTDLFIVFENSIDHFGLYKGCLLKQSKLFNHISNKLYYWCEEYDSGEKGLNHEFKFSKFVWNKTIEVLNNYKISDSYVGFSHVDEIPNEFSIFNLLNEPERRGVVYQDGTFFYGNHKLIYGNIYMDDDSRNNSYPYPAIWPQEKMNHPPKDFKYRECFRNCPKINFGVHLSPWPNPITEAIKYLMCSECEGRRIEKVINHCKRTGKYKTMMPGGKYYNKLPKPTLLPRYLSDNKQKFNNFFIDFYD